MTDATTPEQPHDPFYDEAKLHGWAIPRDHNYIRDLCREATDCERCVSLIEAFDAAMMGALFAGTGPWA